MALWGERKGWTLVAALLAVTAIVIAAGCGGDDDDSASQPQTTADNAGNQSTDGEGSQGEGSGSNGDQDAAASGPKAEFLREGNGVCRKVVAKIQRDSKKVLRELGPDREKFLDEAVNDVLLPNLEAEVRGLRRLEPPPGDEQQVQQVIVAIEDVITGLETNPNQDDYYPYEEAEKLADRYGLNACGGPAL